jgi:hypothetical protein
MQEIIELLKAIPSQAWIALTTAVLTAGLTLIGIWFTNRANNQRLRIQLEHEIKVREESLTRERLEELYVESNKYLGALVSYYLPFRMVMKGEISFNQALDMTIESGSRRDYEPHRVTMLIHMYFPQIIPEFDQIMNLRGKLNEIVDGYKEQYKAGDFDGSRWLEIFQPLLEKLGVLTDNFDKHVVKLKQQ